MTNRDYLNILFHFYFLFGLDGVRFGLDLFGFDSLVTCMSLTCKSVK